MKRHRVTRWRHPFWCPVRSFPATSPLWERSMRLAQRLKPGRPPGRLCRGGTPADACVRSETLPFFDALPWPPGRLTPRIRVDFFGSLSGDGRVRQERLLTDAIRPCITARAACRPAAKGSAPALTWPSPAQASAGFNSQGLRSGARVECPTQSRHLSSAFQSVHCPISFQT